MHRAWLTSPIRMPKKTKDCCFVAAGTAGSKEVSQQGSSLDEILKLLQRERTGSVSQDTTKDIKLDQILYLLQREKTGSATQQPSSGAVAASGSTSENSRLVFLPESPWVKIFGS